MNNKIENKLNTIQNIAYEEIKKYRYKLSRREHKIAFTKFFIDFYELFQDLKQCQNESEVIDLISVVSVYYSRLQYEEEKKKLTA